MRTFGVELEFISELSRAELAYHIRTETGINVELVTYSNKDASTWRLKTDSSVMSSTHNCMELVTPILHGEDGMAQLLKVVECLQGKVDVNHTCGLHVHHGIAGMDANELRKILKFYLKYEAAMDKLQPISRRNGHNRYCEHVFDGGILNPRILPRFKYLNKIKSISKLCKNNHFGHKYRTLNTAAFAIQGTLEFRHHAGTMNADKINNWVRLTAAIVGMSKQTRGTVVHKTDYKDTYTTKQFLMELKRKLLISNDTYKFYKKRYKTLNYEVCR